MTDVTGTMDAAALPADRLPRHIAVVMDGNGRWARARMLPRTAGHRAGVGAVRRTVECCGRLGIRALTLFAFSSENWRRPREEVSVLMDLLLRTLEKESEQLHENGVRIRLVGDRERLGPALNHQIARAERLTAGNTGLELVIAASYGGRWDIAQAGRRIAEAVQAGELTPEAVDEAQFHQFMSLSDLPPPDLLIRTGGERRISNFLLWQLAYAELYFSDTLWPDFSPRELDAALCWYAGRERRFGGVLESREQAGRA